MATEIENLRTRKETLKCELQAEEQKEKSLQEEIETLREKIEIRDLEESLDTKRESVRQLESQKSELQDKWNQPNQDTKKDEEQKEPTPELILSVEPNPNLEPVQSEESNRERKRRFF